MTNKLAENNAHKRRHWAHKKQGGVQVSDILRGNAIVMFVRNFLVDGPKVCDRVGILREESRSDVDCPLKPGGRKD